MRYFSTNRQSCYMVRADELYAEVSQDPSGKTPSQVRMSRMAFFDALIALQSQARPSNLLLFSCPLFPFLCIILLGRPVQNIFTPN